MSAIQRDVFAVHGDTNLTTIVDWANKMINMGWEAQGNVSQTADGVWVMTMVKKPKVTRAKRTPKV